MWEDRFAQEGYLFGTEPVPFLLKHNALFQAGPSALSIAEGEGRNGVYLAKVVVATGQDGCRSTAHKPIYFQGNGRPQE
jgi:hypothetical protein